MALIGAWRVSNRFWRTRAFLQRRRCEDLKRLIAERPIDYIRLDVSQHGGFTPACKIATMGEIFGVKTAWQGPGDVSPVGQL